MNAKECNQIYEEMITKRLQELGYFQKGKSLYLQRGTTVAALLRSTYRGDQGFDLTYCVRHTFLRDMLNLSTNNIYLTDPVDYPFRYSILDFKEADLFTLSYVPIN